MPFFCTGDLRFPALAELLFWIDQSRKSYQSHYLIKPFNCRNRHEARQDRQRDNQRDNQRDSFLTCLGRLRITSTISRNENGMSGQQPLRKISARISLFTGCRPPGRLTLESHFQYSRNPARCHSTTVLGVTKTRGFFHPRQSLLKATQNSFCLWRRGDDAIAWCVT